MNGDPSAAEPKGSWQRLFHQSTRPVYLLNMRRRLRYGNPALERLIKLPLDAVLHEQCRPLKLNPDLPSNVRHILQALSPPKEAIHGRTVRVRRPVPPARQGPPWWEILFIPILHDQNVTAILAMIDSIAPSEGAPTKSLPEAWVAMRQEILHATQEEDGERTLVQQRIDAQVALAGQTTAPVWIVGEAGTGKKEVARRIHFEGVHREKSIVTIDCLGVQPYLIRSLLFGQLGLASSPHLGTLLIVDPEHLPLDLQAEFIEWHREQDVVPRVIVATCQPSRVLAEFRNRFSVIDIYLPSLANRKDEVDRRVRQFIELRQLPPPAADFLPAMQAWSWPKNFVELDETLRSAADHAKDQPLQAVHLPRRIRDHLMELQLLPAKEDPTSRLPLEEVLAQVESRMIRIALKKCRNDLQRAAHHLGITKMRLTRRMKALGIE
ncbi:MAG: sigma 54-interacting transcriptional regulator [Zavarzinella sp.]